MLKKTIMCVLFLTTLTASACQKPSESSTPETPTSEQPASPPSVSFDGDEQIEPMFPAGETAPVPDDATTLLQSRPNPKFAQDATVKLPQVDDLVPQVDVYIGKLEKTLEDLDGSVRFVDDADVLFRDANTLAMIALALGLSKEDNPYKKAAPAIIEAAHKVEAVKNLDEATQAVAEVKKALKAEAGTNDLSWDKKVASLKPIMKAVPNINTQVKRNLRTEAALKKGGRKVVEGAAVLAVIGQGSIPNAVDTIKPDAVKDWKIQCLELRDAALELNRAASGYEAGKAKFEEIQAAYERLSDSCDSCHKIFYAGELPTE